MTRVIRLREVLLAELHPENGEVEITFIEPWSGDRLSWIGVVDYASEAGTDSVFDCVALEMEGGRVAGLIPVKWIQEWRVL
jgi:hypothetical protein